MWKEVSVAAGDRDPTLVAPWVAAASAGILGAVEMPTAVRLLAGLLVAAAQAARSDPEALHVLRIGRQGRVRIRQRARPDTATLELMYKYSAQQLGPTGSVTAMAQIGAALQDRDREALLRFCPVRKGMPLE